MQPPKELEILVKQVNSLKKEYRDRTQLCYRESKYFRKYRFKLEILDTTKSYDFRYGIFSKISHEQILKHVDEFSCFLAHIRLRAKLGGDKIMLGSPSTSYFTNDLDTIEHVLREVEGYEYLIVYKIYYSHDLDRAICVRDEALPYNSYRFRLDVKLSSRQQFQDLMEFVDQNPGKLKYNDASKSWAAKYGYSPTETRFYALDEAHLGFALLKHGNIVKKVTEYKLASEIQDEYSGTE